ncbi:unnamed protein product [Didymodactylos carnosus]|uniref:Uncharacterized protein n=1 Tax=Didymodactylos carnosus TaxID=1234261 RepID=A0A815PVX8_9BILA|nr:unnamed protein product [Didymodactylos carnosus]CAF4326350.1 unnamed protein product [Didymodactylos carnosus]
MKKRFISWGTSLPIRAAPTERCYKSKADGNGMVIRRIVLASVCDELGGDNRCKKGTFQGQVIPVPGTNCCCNKERCNGVNPSSMVKYTTLATLAIITMLAKRFH